MTTFRIRPGSFQELRTKLLVRSGIFYFAILLGGTYLYTDGLKGWDSWLPVAAMLVGIAAFSWRRNLKRQALLFESMCLTVDEAGLVRTQHDTPTKTLSADEIISIGHLTNGDFLIKGPRPADNIWMPAQVEHSDELAQALRRFGPVLALPAPAWYKTYASLLGLLTLPLMYFFYTSPSKIVTAGTGLVLIGGLGYAQWVIRRSQDIDRLTKRYSLAGWVVILALLAALVFKLSM